MAQEMDFDQPVMNVGGFSIGASREDPGYVAVTLSASRDGPHAGFRFDADTLDRLSTALADAAKRLRATAN